MKRKNETANLERANIALNVQKSDAYSTGSIARVRVDERYERE